MSFNIPEQNTKKTYDKVNFLRLTPGNHLIRIVEDPSTVTTVYTHYVMGKFTIECPGDGCPICENNKKLVYEHKDDFRNQKGWAPRTTRFLLNVLDRTLVKTCPHCSVEVKPANAMGKFPTNCPECNGFITEVKAMSSNKVKILGFGVKLATDLNAIEKSICDPTGEPIGLTKFDIVLSVDGKAKTPPTPIPVTTNNDVVPITDDMLQDASKATIKLTTPEILELLRGISLKDIYKARSTQADAKYTEAFMNDDKAPWVDTSALKSDIAGLLDN
jgi:hypothetical protein